jgi:hypothetical protein
VSKVLRALIAFAFFAGTMYGQSVVIRHGGTQVATRLDTALCQASTITLDAELLGAPQNVSYSWTIDNAYLGSSVTLTNNTSSSVSIATTQPTSIETVQINVSADEAGTVTTHSVTLILFPAVSLTLNNPYCSTSASSTLNTGNPSGGAYSSTTSGLVTVSNGVYSLNPSATSSTGNYPVTYTISYTGPSGIVRSCASTNNAVINYSKKPNLDIYEYATQGSGNVVNDSVLFNGLTTFVYCFNTAPLQWGIQIKNPSDFTAYSINWGDNSAISTGVPNQNSILHSYNLAGIYPITLTTTDINNCSRITQFNLFFGTNPAAGLAFNGNSTGCIRADSTGINYDFTINNWQQDPIGVLYKFSLNTNSIPTVTIASPLVLDLSTGTTADPRLRYDPNTGILTYRQRFTASSCGLSIDQNGQPINNVYGFYLTKQSPCGISYSSIAPVSISTMPTAGVTGDIEICENQSGTFTDASSGGQVVIYSSFNDTYTCSSVTKGVWRIVQPNGYTLTTGTLGALGSINKFSPNEWTIGSSSITLNFTTPGTYTIVRYIGLNQQSSQLCGIDSARHDIVVHELPPIPDPITDQALCNGSQTNPISFTPTTHNGRNLVYNWTNNLPSIGLAASGTGNIGSFTAVNTTNSPVTATVTVTPRFTTAGNVTCTGPSRTFTITVNPTPTVSPIPDQIVCTGSATNAVTFTSPTTGGNITYSWTNSNTTIGLGATNGQSNGIPSFNGVNSSTTTPTSTTITVTPTWTDGTTTCVGPSQTFTITVNPTIDMDDPSDQVVCANGATTAVTFTAPAVNAGTVSYQWTNDNTSIGLAGTGSGNIASFTALNATNTAQVATVTVTPYYTNTQGGTPCPGTPQTFTITVNPAPTVDPISDIIVCDGATVSAINFSSQNTGGTVTYSWTNDNTAIGLAASGSGSSIASFTATNSGSTPLVANITVTPTFTNGNLSCPGTPETFTITVNPTATVNQVTSQVVCHNQGTTAIAFSSPLTGGTMTYNWTNDNTSIGLVASGSGDIASFTATNPTGTAPEIATITVIPSYSNGGQACTGTAMTFTITVNPLATATNVPDVVACNGGTVAATTFSSPTTGGSIVYDWTNTTPSIGLAASGTGNLLSFTAVNLGSAPVVATVTVTPTYTNGGVSCTGTPKTFTITVNPTATVDPVSNQELCNGALTNDIIFTSPTTGGSIVYNWTNTDGSIGLATSGSGNITSFPATNSTTAPVTATITVTPTYTNGGVSCPGTPSSFTITVHPTPTVTTVSDIFVCTGTTTNQINFTSPTTGGQITYAWSSTSNAIGLSASTGSTFIPSFEATNTGSSPVTSQITVTPTYTNGSIVCVGTPMTFNYTVNPIARVTAVPDQTICSGGSTTTINFTSPTTGGTIVYNWTNTGVPVLAASGTGNISSFSATNATNAPITGSVIVTPTYTNGVACTGRADTFLITVLPAVTMNQPTNQLVCNGGQAGGITLTSNLTPSTSVSYNWVNNTPSIGLNATGSGNIPTFTATNTGTAPVTATITLTPTYTATNGTACIGATRNVQITVNPTPTINAGVTNFAVCNGQVVTPTAFASPNTGGTVTYTWSRTSEPIGFSTGGSGSLPTFTATNTGNSPITTTVTVTPTFANGGVSCTGTPVTFTITVNPTPNVTLTNQTFCIGQTASLVFGTTNQGVTVNYAWTSDITTIGLASSSGTGTIPDFTTTNGGTEPLVATITVTPSFTNAGVTCTGTAQTFTVTVLPNVVPDQVTNEVYCVADAVASRTFTTQTIGGTVSYAWTNDNDDIGLGQSGNGPLPAFTATNTTTAPISGTITVTPTITLNGVSCQGTAMTYTITVNPQVRMVATPDEVLCEGSNTTAINFASTSTGSIVYNWTNSNTNIGLNQPSGTGNISPFAAVNGGTTPSVATFIVTPQYTNAGVTCFGRPDTFSITVNPIPSVNSINNLNVCVGAPQSIALTSPNTGGTVTYAWSSSNTAINLTSGSTNPIVFTPTNSTNAAISSTITVIPTFTNGNVSCTGPPTTFTITVNPTATVDLPANQEVCDDDFTTAINFSSSQTVGTVTYSWTNSEPTIGLAATGTGDIASFQATNTTAAPIVATITVTPNFVNGSTSCPGTPQTFTITVNPDVTVNVSNQTICAGPYAGYTFTSPTTSGVTYAWTNSNTGIGLISGGTGNIPPFTASNSTSSPLVATITVTPTYSSGGITCVGTPTTFTLTVNPPTTVNAVSDVVVCNGGTSAAIVFSSPQTSGGAVSYSWTNSEPSIGLLASGTGNLPTFIAVNQGTQPVVATITVTPIFSNGSACSGTPLTFTITVNPTPTVVTADQVVCNGSNTVTTTFTSPNTGGTVTYDWTNTNTTIGLGATGSGQITSFQATNTTNAPVTATITVTPSFENGGVICSGTPDDFTISVNPTPTVSVITDRVVCHNQATSISFSSPTTGGTISYNWTNTNTSIGLGANGSGNINSFNAQNLGTAPVTATISVTATYLRNGVSCVGPARTFTITVNPTSQVDQINDQVLCVGDPSTLVTFGTPNTGGTVTYSWTNNQPGIGLSATGSGSSIASFNATNAGTTPLVATITVTPLFSNGGAACPGTPRTFTITVNPTATVNPVADQTVCDNQLTTAISFSSPQTGGTVTYDWTNTNTNIGLASSGTGDITAFTATNAITSPEVATITVTPTFTNGSVACTGTPRTFTITVLPNATVAVVSSQVVCNAATTTAVAFSSPNTGGAITYQWTNTNNTIGLGSSGTGNIPAFTAVNTGTSPLTATITVTPLFALNGVSCSGTPRTFTYTINPTATVVTTNQVVCNGSNTAATNFTSPATGGTVTYAWSNNNTSIGLGASGTGQIPSFQATNSGSAPVTATITVTPSFENGGVTCPGTPQNFTITVNPTATVNAITNRVVCNGQSVSANFSSPTTGGAIVYNWTNSDPSIGLAQSGTGNTAAFNAVNSGTSPVTATVTVTPSYTANGITCTGTARTFTITVNPTPQVSPISDQVLCVGDPSTLVTFATPNTGGTVTYSWSNNETGIGLAASGSGSGIPSFNATNSGLTPLVATITVTPTFANGGISCTGTPETFTITVNPTATVIVSNQTVCDGGNLAVNFTSPNTGGTLTYAWTNDNTSINLAASGTSSIASFAASNNGTSPVVANITVTPTFTNGGVSCVGTPRSFTITVLPTATVDQITSQVVCNGGNSTAVVLTSPNSGGTITYQWANSNTSIGLGANGTGSIPAFTAVNSGTAPVTATITVTPIFALNGVSCSGTPRTFTYTVNPTATVVTTNQVVCNGGATTTTNFTSPNTGGTVTYAWSNNNTSIGLGASGTGQIPSFQAVNGGSAPVTATITVTPSFTNGGVTCAGTPHTFTISVNPTATVTPITDRVVCHGQSTSVSFSSPTTGGTVTYAWSNSDPSIGLAANGTGNINAFNAVNTGTSPVTATITVTPTYARGGVSCVGTPRNFTITVNPVAVVNPINNQVVCNGAQSTSVNFTTTATGGTVTYSWTNSNPSIGLAASGTGDIAAFTASNSGSSPVTATVTVTPSFSSGGTSCTGTPRTFTITVNPTATVTVTDQVVCNGANTSAISFSSPTTGGTLTYAWTNNNPGIGLATNGTGNIASFAAINSGTAPVVATVTVTPTYTNLGVSCTGTPSTFTITVNPTATVDQVSDQVVCNNGPTNTIAFTSPTTGGTVAYNWTNNNPSIGLAASGFGPIPSFTAINGGSAPITATIIVTPSYTNAGVTCTGTPTSFDITVNPTATVNVSNQVVCNGGTSAASFSSPTTGGTVTYAWSNDNTSIGLAASGTGNISSFTAINTGTTPVTATVTVTPSFTNGGVTCVGTPSSFTIVVNPTATVNVSNRVVCNGDPTSVSFSSPTSGGIVTYAWSNNNSAIGLAASGTGNITTFSATNSSNAPITGTITVTPSFTNGGITCVGTPSSFTITVNPTATVNPVSNQVVCNGGATAGVNFGSPTTGGIIVYNWTNNTTSIGLPATGAGNIGSFSATNNSGSPVTATITVTPSYTSGGITCVGTPRNFTITVNPTATVNVTDQTICNGDPTSVTFTSPTTGGSIVYSWTNSNLATGLSGSGTGDISTFSGTNNTNGPVVSTVTVIPTFTNGGVSCTGTPASFTITVNPTATVTSIANQVVCNAAPTTAVNFSSPTTGGSIVYNWSNDNTSIGLGANGTGNIPSFNAVNNSTAPVTALITVTPTYTLNGVSCVGTPQSFTITVNPTATVNVTDQVVCNNATTAPSVFTSPTTGGSIVYNWTNDNTTIGLPASGTGNIGAFTAVNTGSAPVIASVTVTPVYTSGGVTCTGSASTFTITVNPTATVTPIANQVVCDSAVTSVNFSSPTTGGTIVYTWTNSNTNIGLPANGTGSIAPFTALNSTSAPISGTITVTPNYTNAGVTCIGTPRTFTITVNPKATVNTVANQIVCNGAATAAVLFSSPTTGGSIVYQWTNNTPSIGMPASGNGSIGAFNAVNTTTAPVTATIIVTPIYTNGGETCNGVPRSFTITVNPTATAIVADQTVCSGNPMSVTFTSPNTGGTLSYSWTNNNTAIGLTASGTGNISSFSPTNSTNAPIVATITVTPTFTNGGISCTGTPASFNLTVNPVAVVNPIANQRVCDGAPTAAVNFTSPTTGGSIVYNWTNSNTAIGLGAAGTGDIPSFSATNTTNAPISGTITVTPTYTNNGVSCTGTPRTFVITVNPTALVNVSNQVVCNNGITNPINFTSATTGGTIVYNWTNSNTTIGLAASGTGNIPSFVATNATQNLATSTIIVTPVYTSGGVTCTGTPSTFTISVSPTSTLTPISNQVVCNGAPTVIPFTSPATGGTMSYTWTNNNTNIGLGASGAGSNLIFAATNSGSAPIAGTITVTPIYTYDSVSCPGTPFTFSIIVNPTPTVNAVANQVVCDGGLTTAVNFVSPTTGGSISFDWTNSEPSIGLSGVGSGNLPAFNATNSTNTPIVASITVTPQYTNAGITCPGTPITFTITVNPTPTVNVANQTVCNGAATSVTFTSSTTGGIVTYNWFNSNTNIGLAETGTGNIPAFSANNGTSVAITSIITVTPSFTNGGITCVGDPTTFTITVNPTATVDQVPNQTVCTGATTAAATFTSPLTGGLISYSWTNDNPAIGIGATGNNNFPSFPATNPGTTPLTGNITVIPAYTSGGQPCPGTPMTFSITVNPTATVTVANQTRCNGDAVPALTFSSPNSGGTVTYTWFNDNTSIGLPASGAGGLPAYTATNPGLSPISANVTVTPFFTHNGVTCPGTPSTFTITVNPTATVNVNNLLVCDGQLTSVNFTTPNLGGTVTYSWTNSNTGIGLTSTGTGNILGFNAINPTSTPIVSTLVVTPLFTNAGVTCTGTPSTFTITVNPRATVNQVADQVVCTGGTTQPVVFGSPAVLGTMTYDWTNSNPAIGIPQTGSSNMASYAVTNTGSAPAIAVITVTPSYTNGGVTCSGIPYSFTITVNPSAAVTLSDQTVCNGGTAAINFGSPTSGGSVTYQWTHTNPSIGLLTSGSGNIPAFIAVNNGSAPVSSVFTVTPIYTNGGVTCPGTPSTFTLTVNPTATVNVSNLTVCHNAVGTANFTTPTLGGTVTYDWSNSNSQVGLSQSGSGSSLSFTATNTTGAPISSVVTVTPFFTLNGVSCPGTPSTFTITVNPVSVPNPIADQALCNGDQTTAVSFSTPTLGGSVSYTWTNNNPGAGLVATGSGSVPVFTAINNGNVWDTATVTVRSFYSLNGVTCPGDSVTYNYIIYNDPLAPVPVQPMAYCQFEPADSLAAIALPNHQLRWYTSPTSPVFSLSAPTPSTLVPGITNYYVSQISPLGCESPRAQIIIQVMALPAKPEGQDVTYCQGDAAVPLVANLLPGHIPRWYGVPTGGLAVTAPPTPSTATAGTFFYYVSQINPATDCESFRDTLVVTVNPKPTANWSAALTDGDSCSIPQTYLFTNTSSGYDTQVWNLYFGGALLQTDTVTNFSRRFSTSGRFTLELIVTSPLGCQDTMTQELKINAGVQTYLTMTPLEGCEPLFVEFEAQHFYNHDLDSLYRVTFISGDGASINIPLNDIHTFTYEYTRAGTYRPYLIATMFSGCDDTSFVLPVTVYLTPEADFRYRYVNYRTLEFTNLSTDLDVSSQFLWTFGDGGTSTDFEPTHSYAPEFLGRDSIEICLYVTNYFGCADTVCYSEWIWPAQLNVPNAFAPEMIYVEDDNLFVPKGHSLEYYHLRIYDKWGNLVFETQALDSDGMPAEPWNGRLYNTGDLLPMGAYVWTIEARYNDGVTWPGMPDKFGKTRKHGTVTLLR